MKTRITIWDEITAEFEACTDDGRIFHLREFTHMTCVETQAETVCKPGQTRVCTAEEGYDCFHQQNCTWYIPELDVVVHRV